MVLQEKLPALGYEFGDLEPYIASEIMMLHYTKHHQAYVNNLNKALEQYAEAEARNDIAQMIALESAIKFNGGGHVNHSIFWTNLAPKAAGGGTLEKGSLLDAITAEFGSLEAFIEQMSARAVAIQGSGWAWLGFNKTKKRLEIATCDNQDPLSTKGLVPLLGIDVWEHSYYLQYKNVRADYVKAIWNVVNWKNVQERFELAKK
ncbi:MAG: superoxide dismutase [Verrucomicrobia bacterium]|nr:superoxide dismutase [Verrucomicrobiota bacterium]MBS0636292.1 superoxide dismutase [Verrucomicrobiota bacterium]